MIVDLGVHVATPNIKQTIFSVFPSVLRWDKTSDFWCDRRKRHMLKVICSYLLKYLILPEDSHSTWLKKIILLGNYTDI